VKKTCLLKVEHTRIFSAAELFFSRNTEEEEDGEEEEASFSDPYEEEEEQPRALYRDAAPCAAPSSFSVKEPPSMVLTTRALLWKKKDGSICISYEDSDASGEAGTLNTFRYTPTGVLFLLRGKNSRQCLIFSHESRYLCDYGAQGSLPLPLTVHTQSLQGSLDEEGGSLELRYSVELRGSVTERNRLRITVETAENFSKEIAQKP
jgi:uncharacterized beta-barrel protein YwiB (DUF1934 family)